jgi:hypothetical protein
MPMLQIRPLAIPIKAFVEKIATLYFIKAFGSLKINFIKRRLTTSKESPQSILYFVTLIILPLLHLNPFMSAIKHISSYYRFLHSAIFK